MQLVVLPLLILLFATALNFLARNNDHSQLHDLHAPESCDQLYDALAVKAVSVVGIPHMGFRIAVFNDSRDLVSRAILQTKMWENHTIQFLATHLQRAGAPPRRFLDIGANLGWFSLYMAAMGHEVHAVEAMQQNAGMIRYSLCMNRQEVRDRVHLHHVAAGESSMTCGARTPYRNRGNGNMLCEGQVKGTVYRKAEHVETGIPVRRLDDVIGNTKIDVIKIDTEGYEFHALAGGRELLRHVQAIHTEFSPRMLTRQGSDPVAYLRFLLDAGFAIYEGMRRVTDPKDYVRGFNEQRWNVDLWARRE